MIDKANPTPRAVGNGLLAVLFLSLGALNAFSGEAMDAAVWFSLGGALAVLGSESTPWNEIKLWRRVVGAGLTGLGVALIAANLWIDFTT